MIDKILMTSLGALVVAGCTPEIVDALLDGVPPSVVGPTVQQFGIIPAGVTAEYDVDADAIILSNDSLSVTLEREEFYDVDGFEGYSRSSGGQHLAAFAQTSSGGGYAAVVSASVAVAFGGFAGGEFARLGDTEMPQSGSAEFTGNYVGWLALVGGLSPARLFSGDAELTANFDSSEISGLISSRVNEFGPYDPLNDLILNTTAIVDGGFAGTTSGGALQATDTSAADGEYFGLIVGANGQEIVGGVRLEHVWSGTNYVEVGSFIAEK